MTRSPDGMDGLRHTDIRRVAMMIADIVAAPPLHPSIHTNAIAAILTDFKEAWCSTAQSDMAERARHLYELVQGMSPLKTRAAIGQFADDEAHRAKIVRDTAFRFMASNVFSP